MYKAKSDTEGILERVYLVLEASPTVSIASDDDTDSTEESDGKYDTAYNADVHIRMEDEVDALDGIGLGDDVDMDRDSVYADEEDEEEKDDEEKDEDKEERDENDDDGKELRTIGQGEMGNTVADDVDTMVDEQLILLPAQGQEILEHTPWPRPIAPTPRPPTPEPRSQLRTLQTQPPSRPENMDLVMLPKPLVLVPTLRETEAAGNTSDMDVDQQLLS